MRRHETKESNPTGAGLREMELIAEREGEWGEKGKKKNKTRCAAASGYEELVDFVTRHGRVCSKHGERSLFHTKCHVFAGRCPMGF